MSYPPWPKWTAEQWRDAPLNGSAGVQIRTAEFSEYQHPRDEQGRFTDTTGDTFFHGTLGTRLDSILKEGLTIAHTGEDYNGSIQGHTYVTVDPNSARMWALRKAQSFPVPADAAVLEIHIPPEKLQKVSADPHYTQEGAPERKYLGNIHPDWIKNVWVFHENPSDPNPYAAIDNKNWMHLKVNQARDEVMYVAIVWPPS